MAAPIEVAVRLKPDTTNPRDTNEYRVRIPSGGSVRLRSLHDPEREANDIVEHALSGSTIPPIAVVIGVGLRSIVEALVVRRPDVRVLAFEIASPPPQDLRAEAREARPDGGATLVACAPGFNLPLTTWPATVLADEPRFIVQPIARCHWPELVEEARRAALQYVFERRANEEARQRLAPMYLEHTLQNLPELLRAPDVSALDGIAGGEPLVLCGAGPSLDRLLPDLRGLAGRAWVVALDTAVHPLLGSGIEPDLIVSIDPTPLNGRHLLNLPVRSRPWLVAEVSVDPRAIRAFSGRTIACRIGNADPWPWLEANGVSTTRVRAWGSVLTAACDIVRRMRPSHVAFAGIDLAYTGDQPYCRGTAFESDWEAQRLRDGLASIEAVWAARLSEDTVLEPDVTGRGVRTAGHMIAFRNWVRTFVAEQPSCEYANVSGTGILHGPGITQSSLRQWVAEKSVSSDCRTRVGEAVRNRGVADGTLARAVDRAIDTSEPADTWSVRVPRISSSRINLLLEQAAREMRGQGAGVVNQSTGWMDVPFDPACFFAKEPMTWEVTESNVGTFAYRLDGKTLALSFKINRSTLAGQPSSELFLRLPGNCVAARGAANTVWIGSRPIRETGYATVHPGHDFVVVLRANEQPFPLERDDFFLFGQLQLEVQ